ncbi:LAQU0S23e00210g1_1 [Lachancea quebecensis]|uniref:LAQU0S23e00210g1_1 n=1 Tax=Lachancea quebecensis TaxID=1654605 RepID=A0A0P1KZN5_9SACH|nr:LAQU0S23e00210g1_1 [Lachancea quebecensis]
MVCDLLVYHPSVSRLIRLLDASAGREKVLRLLQYLCRFLGEQYSMVLARKLQAEFALVRKMLRFLKPLNHLQAASKLFDNKIASDNIARWCNVIKNLAYAGYLALDHVTLLRLLRLVPTTPVTGTRIPRWSNWCWFAGLSAGLVLDLRQLQVAQERGREDKEASKAVAADRAKALRRLLWDSLDTFIVLNNLKFLHSPDNSVGLAGVATSLFGLQGLWETA